jgi:hypothetical protein
MKWKTQPIYKEGDRRVRIKFAWLPVTLTYEDNTYTVWLETYAVLEEYYTGGKGVPLTPWRAIKKQPLFYEGELP